MRERIKDAIEKDMGTYDPCTKYARDMERIRRYWQRKAKWRIFWSHIFFWR